MRTKITPGHPVRRIGHAAVAAVARRAAQAAASLTADETMLQLTAQRADDRRRFGRRSSSPMPRHADQIEAQLAAVGAAAAALILEPVARNTAPGHRAGRAAAPTRRRCCW